MRCARGCRKRERASIYYADLAGLRADNEAGERIGSVVGVQNYGAGDLLEVRLDGASVTELIPFTDAYVPVVDIAAGRVVVVMPASTDDDEGGDEDGGRLRRLRPAADAAGRR